MKKRNIEQVMNLTEIARDDKELLHDCMDYLLSAKEAYEAKDKYKRRRNETVLIYLTTMGILTGLHAVNHRLPIVKDKVVKYKPTIETIDETGNLTLEYTHRAVEDTSQIDLHIQYSEPYVKSNGCYVRNVYHYTYNNKTREELQDFLLQPALFPSAFHLESIKQFYTDEIPENNGIEYDAELITDNGKVVLEKQSNLTNLYDTLVYLMEVILSGLIITSIRGEKTYIHKDKVEKYEKIKDKKYQEIIAKNKMLEEKRNEYNLSLTRK